MSLSTTTGPSTEISFAPAAGATRQSISWLLMGTPRRSGLIEVKDYRQFRRVKDAEIRLWDEVGIKARDTLAGIFATKVNGVNEEAEFAKDVLRATEIRVVLHLEQPPAHTKMFPRAYDLAILQQRLKQIVKPIDAHPLVVELATINRVPWRARSIP